MARTKAEANRFYAVATASVIGGLLAISLIVWLFRPADLDAATLCPTSRPLNGHTVVIVDRTDRWTPAIGATLSEIVENAQRETQRYQKFSIVSLDADHSVRPLNGHTVVIVDRTDRWTPAIGATLSEIVENAQRETQRYQKFSIVSLDADHSVRPLFSVCNPGEPDFWSDLYRGRRYTVRDFDQRFVGAAERIVEEVREPSEAPESPIVEYVHRWLGGDDFNASVPHRRLILISDMRQNTPLYSIYSDASGQGLPPVVEHQFGPAAEGVMFNVYFIAHGQEHGVSEDDVRGAWERAFGAIGATYDWRQIN